LGLPYRLIEHQIFPEAPQCGFGCRTVRYVKIVALKIATLSINLAVVMASSRCGRDAWAMECGINL
jgi:hypothetical protein